MTGWFLILTSLYGSNMITAMATAGPFTKAGCYAAAAAWQSAVEKEVHRTTIAVCVPQNRETP